MTLTFGGWLCAGVALCALPGAAEPAGGKRFSIVAFGASTTAPRGETRIWTDRLRETLRERGLAAEVFNAGVGGNTTEMARRRFERDVLDHHPDLVVIHLGINDAAWDVWKDPPAEGPRVTLDRYIENMAFFVREIRSRGGEAILMTPQAVCWTPRLREMYGKPPYDPEDPDGFNVVLRDYARALCELAERERAPLVDAYGAFQAWRESTGRSLDELMPDGMHPNSEGHGLIAKRLLPEALRVLSRSLDTAPRKDSTKWRKSGNP